MRNWANYAPRDIFKGFPYLLTAYVTQIAIDAFEEGTIWNWKFTFREENETPALLYSIWNRNRILTKVLRDITINKKENPQHLLGKLCVQKNFLENEHKQTGSGYWKSISSRGDSMEKNDDYLWFYCFIIVLIIYASINVNKINDVWWTKSSMKRLYLNSKLHFNTNTCCRRKKNDIDHVYNKFVTLVLYTKACMCHKWIKSDNRQGGGLFWAHFEEHFYIVFHNSSTKYSN